MLILIIIPPDVLVTALNPVINLNRTGRPVWGGKKEASLGRIVSCGGWPHPVDESTVWE
jgi:hypothetical protein